MKLGDEAHIFLACPCPATAHLRDQLIPQSNRNRRHRKLRLLDARPWSSYTGTQRVALPPKKAHEIVDEESVCPPAYYRASGPARRPPRPISPGGGSGEPPPPPVPRGRARGGRDAHPKTRRDASEFAAKSKMARRFVTLGPPRGGVQSAAARAGAAAGPRGSGGAPAPPVPRGRARGGPRRRPKNAFGRG